MPNLLPPSNVFLCLTHCLYIPYGGGSGIWLRWELMVWASHSQGPHRQGTWAPMCPRVQLLPTAPLAQATTVGGPQGGWHWLCTMGAHRALVKLSKIGQITPIDCFILMSLTVSVLCCLPCIPGYALPAFLVPQEPELWVQCCLTTCLGCKSIVNCIWICNEL